MRRELLFPSKAPHRKRHCEFTWILGPICGYRATKPPYRRTRAISSTDPSAAEREQGSAFMPKFDASGLLTAVVTDVETNQILMVAFMDREALEKTRETGLAHFHSRSKGRLWMKGETSGHVLRVQEILVDCDQDALLLRAKPAGPACHTGATSCFYRKLDGDRLVVLES